MHPAAPGSRRGERRRERRLGRAVAAFIVGVAAVLAPLLAAAPAQAAAYGYGEWIGGFWHGSYAEGGTLVYCLDPDLPDPVGSGVVAVFGTNGYGGLSPNQMAGLAALVSTTGQTADPVLAHAVNDAIWIVTSGYTPSDPDTAAQSYALAAWVDAYAPAPGSGTMAMSIATAAAPESASLGTLTVDAVSTAGTTGTISLVNAVFGDTGLITRTGAFAAGQSFPIRGVPPGPGPYKTYAGFYGSGSAGAWPAAFTIYYYGPTYQPMIGVNEPAIVTVTGSAEDAAFRPNAFAPAVTTTVGAAAVAIGETLSDTVRPVVTANADGVVVDWYADTPSGPWAPVTFRAAIYRTAKPISDGEPIPPDAVLVDDSIAFTTDTATDPTLSEISVQGPEANAPGHYLWVWRVDAADQTAFVADDLLDPGYTWQDPARAVETTLVLPALAVTGDASLGVGAVLGGALAVGGGGLVGLSARRRRRLSRPRRRSSFRDR